MLKSVPIEETAARITRGPTSGGNPSLLTLVHVFRSVAAFLTFLDLHSITTLARVTPGDYENYLAWVRQLEKSQSTKEDLVTEVRRLWSYRRRLPATDQLPEAAPWDDDPTSDLVGQRTGEQSNRTPRIPEDVMNPLLAWSIRFIEVFADDIVAAFDEYKTLISRNTRRRRGQAQRSVRPSIPIASSWLEELQARGEGLPGKRDTADGPLQIDWEHIYRVLDSPAIRHRDSEVRRLIESSSLRIEEGAALSTPIRVKLDEAPWLDRGIHYPEAGQHARRLSTACFIVIAYLSGQRVGEVLSLRRGCVSQDEVTRLWLLRGTTWKSAKDDAGNKAALGTEREDPWVVIEIVAKAVATLERLHEAELLFPNVLDQGRTWNTIRTGTARIPGSINQDLNAFVDWVNSYCDTRGRNDGIPTDKFGRLITGSQFRRTLAWHIYRRPRGLIAGAIQYGHLRTQMFLGYAGNFTSGFPDDISFEAFLQRLEEISTAAESLADGEHVSGPAADRYRQRITSANIRFAGRTLKTSQAIAAVTSNPDLQVFPGQGMTCVFDARTALCEIDKPAESQLTPSLDDCRSGCSNMARTDRDVAELKKEASELRYDVDDPLAPAVRHRREIEQLRRIEKKIDEHETSRINERRGDERI